MTTRPDLLPSPASPFNNQKNVNQLVDELANRRHGVTGAVGKEQLVHGPDQSGGCQREVAAGEETLAGQQFEL